MMRGLFLRNLKDFNEDVKKHSKISLKDRLMEMDDAGDQGDNSYI